MATLKPKEFDPTMLLKIQKLQTDNIIKASKKDDAKNFLDTWRMNNLGTKDSGVLPPVEVVPPHLRGIIFKRAAVDSIKIAHEGDHKPDFQLPDGRDYYQYPNHKEEIPVDPSGNPIPQLQINPKEEVAMSPANVPLGDGMIYEAKTQMQKNLKQKYDLMLQEGFIDEVEYKKQMDRHFGTKGKK